MGDVYLAEDTRLDRRVALKLLRPEKAESLDLRERFQREARVAAALNHPSIVHVYSVEEPDGLSFITMELVRGRGPRARMGDGPLPPDRLLALPAHPAAALAPSPAP